MTRKSIAALAVLLLSTGAARAVSDPAEMLKDPLLEARAEAIGRELRCLVCQNASIEESNADLARDLRGIVRERIQAGDTDQQVIAWVVARYGNFVRLRPPLTAGTALLWASPVLGLLAGAGAVWLSRRRLPAPAAPLTRDEQARVRELTGTP